MLTAIDTVTKNEIYSFEGKEDFYRLKSKNRELECRYCKNEVFYKAGSQRVAHFAHFKKNVDCPCFLDEVCLIPARITLFNLISSIDQNVELESFYEGASRLVDCSLKLEDGSSVAYVLFSRGKNDWESYSEELRSNGYGQIIPIFLPYVFEIKQNIRNSFKNDSIFSGSFNFQCSTAVRKMIGNQLHTIDSTASKLISYTDLNFYSECFCWKRISSSKLSLDHNGEFQFDGFIESMSEEKRQRIIQNEKRRVNLSYSEPEMSDTKKPESEFVKEVLDRVEGKENSQKDTSDDDGTMTQGEFGF